MSVFIAAIMIFIARSRSLIYSKDICYTMPKKRLDSPFFFFFLALDSALEELYNLALYNASVLLFIAL